MRFFGPFADPSAINGKIDPSSQGVSDPHCSTEARARNKL